MSRCVDEVEDIILSRRVNISEPYRTRLDGDTSLALKVHVVKQLFLHIALCHGIGRLKQSVGKGRLSVVDMCYYRKIPDLLLSFVRHIALHRVMYLYYIV